jgi:phage replication initiation protein
MKNTTKIDFYSFRVRDDIVLIKEALEAVFAGHSYEVTIRQNKGGIHGFETSYAVYVGDAKVGVVANGGNHQNGWAYIGIDGAGCSWIDDWDRAQQAPLDICDNYQLKRVDIALDVFGEGDAFDKTYQAYKDGKFSPAGSGRPPKCTRYIGERPEDGSTIYVGNRERDKFYRGYEKGKQLLGPAITAAITKDPESFEWGDWVTQSMPYRKDGQLMAVNVWDWFRHEVEFKPKTNDLPMDLIDRRDQYFTGSYPYLSEVLKNIEPEILSLTREKKAKLDLSASLFQIRRMWGNTLFTALVAHKGDITAVWDKIVGSTHNVDLVDAGVLMVDHD